MLDIEAEKRKAVQLEYPELFDALSSLLFKTDPMSINFETNTDEYEPEVGTIIPRLKLAQSETDVQQIVHEEFCRWFTSQAAGSTEKYRGIAAQIWAEWRRCQSNTLIIETPAD
ncbi:hypothetical protein GJ697_25435 [Pseudoduganella sp. FT25W]|uniref:Uncharacterized protein n=1 Tax=Duganella alba TaxID=2666081 RepID=A0A6L5QPH8_9BURK|nr:hypothetical protein [Duganella alba]MRX11172.1 hypothetical protein [Duganella alba]MRX19357.1 hypothetical protein [Duganella alba]